MLFPLFFGADNSDRICFCAKEMTFGKVLEEFKSRLLNGNEEKELYLIDKKSGKKTSARRKLWRKENALCLMKSLIYKDKKCSA